MSSFPHIASTPAISFFPAPPTGPPFPHPTAPSTIPVTAPHPTPPLTPSIPPPGVFLAVGILSFPAGWDSPKIQGVCGEQVRARQTFCDSWERKFG